MRIIYICYIISFFYGMGMVSNVVLFLCWLLCLVFSNVNVRNIFYEIYILSRFYLRNKKERGYKLRIYKKKFKIKN